MQKGVSKRQFTTLLKHLRADGYVTERSEGRSIYNDFAEGVTKGIDGKWKLPTVKIMIDGRQVGDFEVKKT